MRDTASAVISPPEIEGHARPTERSPSSAASGPRATRAPVILLALLLAAATVFALPLGTRPLFNQDEARFALLAREALEHGRWVLPRVRDVVYLNKPPLFFWTVAAASAPFGHVTDASAPIPSVVSALATILGVFVIGRRLWDPTAGLLAAAILVTLPFFFFMTHQVLSDMMVTAWLTWALCLFLAAMERGGRGYWAAFYLCVAGGLATKGPAALVVLVAAVGAAIVDGGWQGVRQLRLPMGGLILGVTALPWLLPYLLQGERSYVHSVVLGHYLDWYFRSKGSRGGAFLLHAVRGLPWILFLIPAMAWWRRHPDPGRRRLLVWTVVIVVAVGLSGEQRARYFLPVFPLVSLLVAEFLARGATWEWPRGRRITLGILAVLALACLGAATALLAGIFPVEGDTAVFVPAPGWERVVVVTAMTVGVLAALVAMWRGRSGASAGASIALALGLVLAVEAYAYPARYARWYALREFAERTIGVLPPDAAIVAYHDANLGYDFYLRRPVRELPKERAAAVLAARPAGAMLIREDHWRPLAASADPGWGALAHGRIAGRTMLLLGAEAR